MIRYNVEKKQTPQDLGGRKLGRYSNECGIWNYIIIFFPVSKGAVRIRYSYSRAQPTRRRQILM